MYQGGARPLWLHMRHQPRYDKASGQGTRLSGAALVLVISAVSLAAVLLLVRHAPAPPVRPDVVAPRLEVPTAMLVRTRWSTGRIVHFRALAVDAGDGVVAPS